MHTQLSVLSVSQLNKQVKCYLENEIGMVHVEGEVSNLSKPYSGHFYFTLKDSSAQIRCVFFKNRHIGSLATKLADGQQVIASGKLSLYEARGDYQLIVEQLTESGLGKLYQQFEELKNKLAAEGLFLQSRKKPIPPIPQTIGVITSTSGAAIRDILSTLARRFPLATILIYPSEVQGATASLQLIKALQAANTDLRCDVLILARGGGSLEDLWAFNDEQLARQIAASLIPVVSGVGHETDFTIADFVADYRAETPTAAAAAVTPNCLELFNMLDSIISRLHAAIKRSIQAHHLKLNHLMDKISSPKKNIAVYWQTLDYLERRLMTHLAHLINRKKNQLHLYSTHLHAKNPKTLIEQTQIRLMQISVQLAQQIQVKINHLKYQLNSNLSMLHAVSPLATLDRGYAIATKKHKVLFTTHQVQIGDTIEVRLAKGNLACEVTQIKD
ncbi:exodeoxyribonuclease VII large subunit [Legionella maioricensis]|uniref:Exodeoxyribonuclease 7 large subunit n=1 Tax=Legionella maioricensis TaxID=2896528 RepID=A0A9X2CZ75_9GAMM|nr:exodeoxyribonuclease VII large subunit [Legionella maioricensis]MCL9683488.1 exodeoxyribonuclease VII large subunit [Legionella maioricensis]MCL9686787.1 exodeoxyribonuclease VII large subunit [Legionella maioricensis]